MSTSRYGAAPSRPHLVLLVHPDASVEVSAEFAREYLALLRRRLGDSGVDVITHWMYSDSFPQIVADWEGWEDRIPKIMTMHRYLDQRSIEAKWDFPQYSSTFQSSTLEWIIDHHGGRITIGGGYVDLCVKETFEALRDQLVDMLHEQNVTAVIDKTMCFDRNGKIG